MPIILRKYSQTSHLRSQELSSSGSEHGLIERAVDLMELTSPAARTNPVGAASEDNLPHPESKQFITNQPLNPMEIFKNLGSLPGFAVEGTRLLPPKSGPSAPRSEYIRKYSEPVEAPSFLFRVSDQRLNEDPQQGGIAPATLVDPSNGSWSPPLYANGFGEQTAGTLYRWKDGRVSQATDVPANAGLTPYRAVTMFYCNPSTQFLVTDGDVRSRDIAGRSPPQDRWYPLEFHHFGTISCLDFAGEHPVLAGNTAGFIERLGLDSYKNREEHAPRAGGLAGNIAMLIALIAFSCRRQDLDAVLIDERAWRNHVWRGHNRPDGRKFDN
jgi:hypothetical protein